MVYVGPKLGLYKHIFNHNFFTMCISRSNNITKNTKRVSHLHHLNCLPPEWMHNGLLFLLFFCKPPATLKQVSVIYDTIHSEELWNTFLHCEVSCNHMITFILRLKLFPHSHVVIKISFSVETFFHTVDSWEGSLQFDLSYGLRFPR